MRKNGRELWDLDEITLIVWNDSNNRRRIDEIFGRISKEDRFYFLINILRNVIVDIFRGAKNGRWLVYIVPGRSCGERSFLSFLSTVGRTCGVHAHQKFWRKKMDRARSGCQPLEEFENHALLPGIQFTPSNSRPVHHVVVLIAGLNDARSEEWHGFSGFRVVKSSGTRSGTQL